MSDRKLSRDAIVTRLPIKTMADMREAIAADPVLGTRKKEARRSAVKKYCDWLGKTPEATPADYQLFKRECARLNPVLCGVGDGRFATVKSLVNRAFLAFRRDLIDTRRTLLLPEWVSLFATVNEPRLKDACGRFARWCSTKNILPEQVNQAAADRYAADLVDSMFARRPRQSFVGMCRNWNAAAARHPALWPQLRLDAGDRRNITVMPREQIDADYRADLEEMLARFSSKVDLVDGFRKPYAPRTIKDFRLTLERLYTVAIRHHRPTPTIKSLADLVRVDVVRSILGYYLERFGTENTKSAGRYAHFLFVVAKYWVRASEADLKILQKHRTVLKPPATGMTEKNRAMLRLFAALGRNNAHGLALVARRAILTLVRG